jgi:hypothetical protein
VRDLRDPEALGKAILERPDKKVPAHLAAQLIEADKVLASSKVLEASRNGDRRDP